MPGTITEFGAACRALRSVRDKIMADQARGLGVSSAFISAVETGAKPIPADYVAKFSDWLQLTSAERDRLKDAANASAKVIKIHPGGGEKAKLVIALAESIEKLSPIQIKQLRSIITNGGG